MRPAMSDSLISGQPLNLLYSYSKRGAPGGRERLTVSLPTQATGRVRLQVTGRPPTVSELGWVRPQPAATGSVRAARPCKARLREMRLPPTGLIRCPATPSVPADHTSVSPPERARPGR